MSNLMDIIYVPLALILKGIFLLVGNYGWSILIFAVLMKFVLLPIAVKGEKGRLRMNQMQPKIKKLDEKFHGDKRNPKYQEELQALYKTEGYSPTSGCLPQLIQLPLIFGIWNAVRRPLTYVCNFSEQLIYDVVKTIVNSGRTGGILDKLVTLFTKDGSLLSATDVISRSKTSEIYIAQAINENKETIDGLKDLVTGKTLIDTKFMGIDLGVTASDAKGWFLLIPVIAAVTSFLVSFLSAKLTQTNINKNDPAARSMNSVMYVMPLFSLWIGYSMNFGVALYWISSNLLSLAQTILLRKFVHLDDPKDKKPPKEKKLNYTQLKKMEREGLLPEKSTAEDETK